MEIKKFNEFINEATLNASDEDTERFKEFTKELAKLSKKYKIAVDSTGGVRIFKKDADLSNIEYSTDPTSGDLEYAI